jgi:hypothetical protein
LKRLGLFAGRGILPKTAANMIYEGFSSERIKRSLIKMPKNVDPAELNRSSAFMSNNAKLAVAVLCFGILHIVGGSMLRHAPAAPSIESAIAPAGDD